MLNSISVGFEDLLIIFVPFFYYFAHGMKGRG